MFDTDEIPNLRESISKRIFADKKLLEDLRNEVRPLVSDVQIIRPRTATSISLVASDGGNNQLVFDPFYVQLVRVVDSYGKQLCLDVISHTTDTDKLSEEQFNSDGTPRTALGRMMIDLGVEPLLLSELSYMIPPGRKIRENPEQISPSWVRVYRDLCEWAVLYEKICFQEFATNTLLVRDGLLRSLIFRDKYTQKWRKNVEEAIDRILKKDRKKVFLVGIAKHSKVYTRYQLALALEEIMPAGEARFVRVPRELEAKSYQWEEYAQGAEIEDTGKVPRFVAGDMYLVRFGPMSNDPVWAVDLFSKQSPQASEIFGYLLSDAINGFPIPYYPRCLQQAHEHAQIVQFDYDILQDQIFNSIRDTIAHNKRGVMDALQLKYDVANRRYE
ncbi:hypothetical protein CUJ83_00740 [Methanocella sp. CWC-04]|uniref:NurA domain-containing protein n=1 Tax=Methanooceanicella nereidis TaxID=2052831 RepID=A0AAP2RC18_9EURY|nr:hypothetical protein [Methanocella sp. CWC-04]MCD1293522.1 hypothetical protein [Methanocella sp. CWC-04]